MRNRPSYIASQRERRERLLITPKIQERRRSREGSNDLSVVWGPYREKPWRRSGATPPSKLAPLANRLQTLPLARRAVPRRLQIVADSPPPRTKRCSVRCKSLQIVADQPGSLTCVGREAAPPRSLPPCGGGTGRGVNQVQYVSDQGARPCATSSTTGRRFTGAASSGRLGWKRRARPTSTSRGRRAPRRRCSK